MTDRSVQILVDSLRGNNITKKKKKSFISLVPSRLRDVSPDSYNPRIVSIGPLHHDVENLKAGELLKRTYVRNLLMTRSGFNIKQTFKDCLRKVNKSMKKIRACYVGMRPYRDAELSRMMVMDCCYILAFLRTASNTQDHLLRLELCRDMLLVENQIPFFILKDIFELTILKSEPQISLISEKNGLINRILNFANQMIFKGDIKITNLSEHADDYDHIMGLLHKCYMPSISIKPDDTNPPTVYKVLELEKSGMSFKPNQDAKWALAIEVQNTKFEWFSWFLWFWVKPTLKMPILNIQDDTEWFLRNIIAYEQTSNIDQYFTSFVKTIDDLVDSGHDIAKLVDSKVIFNYLGSNEEAASMINKICKNVLVSNIYSEQWKELGSYYNKSWPNNIAWLRRTYFNNPWNIIALLAGIVLFTLTAAQTYFTVVQTYFK